MLSNIFGTKSHTDSCYDHKGHGCNHVPLLPSLAVLLLVLTLFISLYALAEQNTNLAASNAYLTGRLSYERLATPKVLGESTNAITPSYLRVSDFTQNQSDWSAELYFNIPAGEQLTLVSRQPNQFATKQLAVGLTGLGKFKISEPAGKSVIYELGRQVYGVWQITDSLIVNFPKK